LAILLDGDALGRRAVLGFRRRNVVDQSAITVSERIFGCPPMASHVVLKPEHVAAGGFVDGAALPAIYKS